MNHYMNKVIRSIVFVIFTVLLSGCVSSMKSVAINKYKGVPPGKFLSEQWYITPLSSQLSVFEVALFKEDQVRKMMDDLSGLCKASEGRLTSNSLSPAAIHETRERILENHSRDKVRKTNRGSTVYDAAEAEGYFSHNMRDFGSDRFVDKAMKKYIQKNYFVSLDCSVSNGSSWSADIIPGDVFTDSSEVVSLPIFVLTKG